METSHIIIISMQALTLVMISTIFFKIMFSKNGAGLAGEYSPTLPTIWEYETHRRKNPWSVLGAPAPEPPPKPNPTRARLRSNNPLVKLGL